MLGFVVLSLKIGMVLPGIPTLPDLIVDHRQAYEDALDAADAAWKDGHVNVTKMEELMGALLARQLHGVYELAGGKAHLGKSE